MQIPYLDQFTLLHRNPDIDPITFAIAHAMSQINFLIENGGSYFGHPEDASSVSPHILAQFIERARQAYRCFEREWEKLGEEIPRIEAAWETGKQAFPKDLETAILDNEQFTFLQREGQVARLYAQPYAHRYWPDHPCEEWCINGYMCAWRAWRSQQGISYEQ